MIRTTGGKENSTDKIPILDEVSLIFTESILIHHSECRHAGKSLEIFENIGIADVIENEEDST